MIQLANNIFLNNITETIQYTSKQRGMGKPLPNRSRITHAQRLERKLTAIWNEVQHQEQRRLAIAVPVRSGTYIEFKGEPNFNLNTKSLENLTQGIRLLNVKKENINDDQDVRYRATIFIPKGKEEFFLKKINEYASEDNVNGPKNENLIATISDINLAVLESFWIGDSAWMPRDEAEWCEIWIREVEGSIEAEESIKADINLLELEFKSEILTFPERKVLMVRANRSQLNNLISTSSYIAEIRRATQASTFFIEIDNEEQVQWAKDLLERIEIEESNVFVSILDTGLNNGHILLEDLVDDSDIYSYFDDPGNDIEGHGTGMAGVAIYGDLKKALMETQQVTLSHSLESLKILPDNATNQPELYGAITSQSISNLYIENPNRVRIICMAVSSESFSFSDGRPSSWSAAIDDSISGYSDDIRKLFMISSGNIRDPEKLINYPDNNQLESIENPGQAWNAITVGAYTNLDEASDPSYELVAKKGELSPYSRTSMVFDKKWPIKPEIVLEGGNAVISGGAGFSDIDVSVLTTHHDPVSRQFTTINASSSATAEASWMAAKIAHVYPDAWPETVRALLIHSAEWTPEMASQFKADESKTQYRNLLRTCGYGVPKLERAINTVQNRVNLIIQSELQPFDKVDGRYVTKDMHIHELPWPKEILAEMFSTEVKLKVTLSYYIEPGPGEIGWQDKYRYASCGLRFDLNGSSDKDSFLRRINKAANDEEESSVDGSNIKWQLGPNNRNTGSIHADTWVGTAAELSTSNYIGIYPVIGWWRERQHLNKWDSKIKYSLIVSLETPDTNVDLLTPIQIQIENSVQTTVDIEIDI